MPKFEANMNYIPPNPPSSMKQCNKSATVKFHMDLLLTTTTRKQSRSGATPILALQRKHGHTSTFQLLKVIRHATPIKSEDKSLKNCLKKDTKLVPKNTQECMKSHHFFKEIPRSPKIGTFGAQFCHTNQHGYIFG